MLSCQSLIQEHARNIVQATNGSVSAFGTSHFKSLSTPLGQAAVMLFNLFHIMIPTFSEDFFLNKFTPATTERLSARDILLQILLDGMERPPYGISLPLLVPATTERLGAWKVPRQLAIPRHRGQGHRPC